MTSLMSCYKGFVNALVKPSNLSIHLMQKLVCELISATGLMTSSVLTVYRGSTSPLVQPRVATDIATRVAAAVTLTVLRTMGT